MRKLCDRSKNRGRYSQKFQNYVCLSSLISPNAGADLSQIWYVGILDISRDIFFDNSSINFLFNVKIYGPYHLCAK